MLPYIAVMIATIFLLLLEKVFAEKLVKITILITISMILISYAGIRDFSVGRDTENYVRYFSRLVDFDYIGQIKSEWGFALLSWIVGVFSTNPTIYLFVIAGITVSLSLFAIVKYTNNPLIALFVYITMGYYTFFFNGARQGIALAIIMLAIPPMINRRFVKFLVITLIAASFHKTALAIIPAYFMMRESFNYKQIIFISIIGITLTASLPILIQLGASVDDRYLSYASSHEGGGEVKAVFLLTVGVIFIVARNLFNIQIKQYSHLLIFYFLGVAISIAAVLNSTNPSGVLRLSTYFSMVSIFIWPIIFAHIKNLKSRVLFGFIFILVCTGYYYGTTSSYGSLVPYKMVS